MYNVSDAYREALQKKVINDRISGTVTLTDGTVIELSDSNVVSGSLKIVHELCGEYRIGTFNLGWMKIGFFADDALLCDFSGAKIKLDYEIETAEGWERVPMGIYIADGSSVRRKRNTITLAAYDYGILFDCDISSEIREMEDTAENIIAAVCERCGVEFGGIETGLPNMTVTLAPVSKQIQSCRDLVEWCAVLLCGYGIIDRDGRLCIISARYYTSPDEELEIVVDKKLTAFERNNIYVTDTRAWIAAISAYSGGERKIYKSTITQNDEQAARAVYSLEKNPLLEGKTEGECDSINTDWLAFVDSFKQRGITAEIYGDPALDAGDVLRCSEGDIDQRRSVVGLVTRQEWRYRGFHTLICASAQLSDGFEEGEETETSKPQAVKVISQLEKKIDNAGGGDYKAGKGIYIDSDNRIGLEEASNEHLGGVKVDSTDEGGFKTDSLPTLALRYATSGQLGGLKLGDGLVPEFESDTDYYGNPYYRHTSRVMLRTGKGLEFADYPVAENDPYMYKQNVTGGKPLAVAAGNGIGFDEEGKLIVKTRKGFALEADGSLSVLSYAAGDGIEIGDNNVIEVKIGTGLSFDEKGALKVTGGGGGSYTAGDGIEIAADADSGEEKISAKLGEGLEFGEDGAINALANIENAVIIQEADAKFLLHNYTQVDYISGNKIGYAGPQNQIIVQGYVFNYTDLAYPATAPYTDVTFAKSSASETGAIVENARFYLDYTSFTADSATARMKCDEYSYASSARTTYDSLITGIYPRWNRIMAPNSNFPYGYIYGELMLLFKQSKTSTTLSNGGSKYLYIPFASEAEYNAAVGLTYEPNVLTTVNETVTEV